MKPVQFRCKTVLRAIDRAGGFASARQLEKACNVATQQRKNFAQFLRHLVTQRVLQSRAGLYRSTAARRRPLPPLAPTAARLEGVLLMSQDGRPYLANSEAAAPLQPLPQVRLHDVMEGDWVRLHPKMRSDLRPIKRPRLDGRSFCGVTRYQRRRVYVDVDGMPKEHRMWLERYSDQPAAGQVVKVRCTRWPTRGAQHGLWGVIEEVLGVEGNRTAETQRLLQRYGFATDFDAAACEAARRIPRALHNDLEGRVDLRDLPMLAVSTEDMPCIDHVFYAHHLPQGIIRLLLSSSDVAHYVAVGGELDRSAATRGHSLCLPELSALLLPPRLSLDLASLQPGSQRLAITVELDIDSSGTVIDSRIYESVVRPFAHLPWSQAREYMRLPASDASPAHQATLSLLRALHAAAQRLRPSRLAEGWPQICAAAANQAVAAWLRDHLVPTLYATAGPMGVYAYSPTPVTDCRVEFHTPLLRYTSLLVHQSLKAAFSGKLPPRTAAELEAEGRRLAIAEWKADQVRRGALALHLS